MIIHNYKTRQGHLFLMKLEFGWKTVMSIIISDCHFPHLMRFGVANLRERQADWKVCRVECPQDLNDLSQEKGWWGVSLILTFYQHVAKKRWFSEEASIDCMCLRSVLTSERYQGLVWLCWWDAGLCTGQTSFTVSEYVSEISYILISMYTWLHLYMFTVCIKIISNSGNNWISIRIAKCHPNLGQFTSQNKYMQMMCKQVIRL